MASPPPLAFSPASSKSFLDGYSSNWFCYWDGSYDVPKDPEKDYAFRPALHLARPDAVGDLAGAEFVYSPGWDGKFPDTPEVRAALAALAGPNASLLRLKITQSLFGSESDYPWLPLLLPPGTAYDPQAVLGALGAHAELKSPVHVRKEVQDAAEEPEEQLANKAFMSIFAEDGADPSAPEERRKAYEEARKVNEEVWGAVSRGGFPLCFTAGSEKLNPVPTFILGKLEGDLVGGFMSVVIHT